MQMLARVQRSYGKARIRSEAPASSSTAIPATSSTRPPLGLAPASAASLSSVASSACQVTKDAVGGVSGTGQVLNFAARIRLASESGASHPVKPPFSTLSIAHWPINDTTFTTPSHEYLASPAAASSTQPPYSMAASTAPSKYAFKATISDSVDLSFLPNMESRPPPSHSTTNFMMKAAIPQYPATTARSALSPTSAPSVPGRPTWMTVSDSGRPLTADMKEREQAIMKERRYRADRRLRTRDPRDISQTELLGYVGRELERWTESGMVARDEEGFDESVSWPGRWKDDFDYALYDE